MKAFSNEAFRFNISISDRCYNHKPTSADYKAMSFHVENLNADELLDKIKIGHSICHVFIDNRRTKSNFMYTYTVFVDVDDSTSSMEEILNGAEMKPTIAYTTFSDGKNNLHRFRLVYILDESVNSEEDYKCLYYLFVNSLHLENIKDNCGSVTSQLMNGNSCDNIRVFCSYLIYDKNSILQKVSLD